MYPTLANMCSWKILLDASSIPMEAACLLAMVKCQLDWTKANPESWSNIISGCVCEGVSGRGTHLNQWPTERRWPSRVRGGIQSVEGLNRIQSPGRTNPLFLVELKHSSSPVLRHRCSWFLDFPTQIKSNTISSIGSQAFRLWLNDTTGFPGSPVYGWRTMRLLGLQSLVNQFL